MPESPGFRSIPPCIAHIHYIRYSGEIKRRIRSLSMAEQIMPPVQRDRRHKNVVPARIRAVYAALRSFWRKPRYPAVRSTTTAVSAPIR